MMKKNYRAVLQYEGTRYQGWQKQISTDNTIQGKLENLLTKMAGENVEVNSSGRTDAGVHAYGQVISFACDINKSPEEIRDYMNQYLPEDIGVLSVVVAGERFHARLNAKTKTYMYRVWNSEQPCVFERKYVHVDPRTLDVNAMQTAATFFLGEHDFLAFCSNKSKNKSTVRYISFFGVERVGNEVVFTITGNGFLHHMVRIIVGTLLEIGRGERMVESVPVLFSAKREESGEMVPSCGLCLMEVTY